MPKSNRSGSRKSSGTVTVIEARVHRSSRRNARVAFVLAFIVVGALTALVASSTMQPVLSLLLGIVTGLVAGVSAWALVRIWTFVRIIWWWLPELTAAAIVVELWTLIVATPFVVRVLVLAALSAALAFPRVRRTVVSVGWCLIVRHRLRVCFAQFIVSNQSGSLPLILGARPTPVGERVWIYLRPGLSVSHLATRLDQIAVACHASAVLVERASSRTAGFVRVDIKRREVLGALVSSPLTGTDPDNNIPVSPAPAGHNRTWARPDMDLPTITPAPAAAAPARVPAVPHPTSATTPSTKAPAAVMNGDEDITDWLD